jgi:RHS repeat-associated protein
MLQQYTPPSVGAGTNVTVYTYNTDRQVTVVTRPDGQVVTLAYTPGGKLQTKTTPDGTYFYTYNPTTGRLTTISAPGGQGLSFGYDGNLMLSEAWEGPVTGRVDRTFDNNFRITLRSVNSANPISFGYDNDGLLTQAGSLAIARSAENSFITGTTIGSVTDARSYSAFGELASFAASFNATPLISFQYGRDKIRRVTEKTETLGGTNDTYTYTYDTAGRLTAVTKNSVIVESYGYDTNGNRITATTQSGTVTGTYDDQDRLLQYGTANYTYTANGELLSKTVGVQTTSYDYDSLGNLLAVTLPNTTQITYVIDGLNRRIGKRVNGTLTQGFLYEKLLHPAAELDGSGNVVSRFVYGTKQNVPDYMVRGDTTYRIISDHLGSPRLVVDVSTGATTQQITYDTFGNILSDTNPGFQPFGFAGGLYDQDTKLTRFGARDYDGVAGRWTAKDPIRFGGGSGNLFGYVRNDPVNLVDPYGLQEETSDPDIFVVYVGNGQEIILSTGEGTENDPSMSPEMYDEIVRTAEEEAARQAEERTLWDEVSDWMRRQRDKVCGEPPKPENERLAGGWFVRRSAGDAVPVKTEDDAALNPWGDLILTPETREPFTIEYR